MKKSSKPKSTRLNAKKGRALKKDSKSGTTTARTGPREPSGTRKGTKRSDLRFIAPDGSEWASPFEWRVYDSIRSEGVANVRRTSPADALSYTTPVKNGLCADCGSTGSCIVQRRVYTPDLFYVAGANKEERLVYLETKGYFSPQKRNLFRAARQSNPQVDIRLIVSSNHWVTKGKTRLTDWAKRFKIPIHVWDGKLPEDWL